MNAIGNQNLRPKIQLTTLDKVAGLMLEHAVLVGNGDEFLITEALSIRNVGKVRVTFLAVLADYKWLINLKSNSSIDYRLK